MVTAPFCSAGSAVSCKPIITETDSFRNDVRDVFSIHPHHFIQLQQINILIGGEKPVQHIHASDDPSAYPQDRQLFIF